LSTKNNQANLADGAGTAETPEKDLTGMNPTQIKNYQRRLRNKAKKANGGKNCAKTIVVKPDELVKIGAITMAEAKSQVRVLMEETQNAKSASGNSNRGRKAAESRHLI
jgi:hypothetical protein